MALVPGDHVGQGADADRLPAGCTAAPPRVGIECPKQRQRRAADGAQLADEIGEGAGVEFRGWDVGILVEARERRLIAAGDAQRAIRHDALDVREVADDFLHAPFAVPVAVHGAGVRQAAQQHRGLLDLRGEHDDRIGFRNPADVADIMRRNLVRLGTADCPQRHAGLPPSSVTAIAFTVFPSPVSMRR